MSNAMPISVLFVCLGNHCRSPAAHAVAIRVANERGLTNIVFDSAGTTGAPSWRSAPPDGDRRRWPARLPREPHRPPHPPRRLRSVRPHRRDGLAEHRRPPPPRRSIDQRSGFYRTVEPEQLQLLRRWDPYGMPGDEEIADPWGRGPDAYRAMYDVVERSVAPMVEHLAWLMSETV